MVYVLVKIIEFLTIVIIANYRILVHPDYGLFNPKNNIHTYLLKPKQHNISQCNQHFWRLENDATPCTL